MFKNTSPHSAIDRQALRRILIAQRHSMGRVTVQLQTASILNTAQALLSHLPAGTVVALYAPLAGEPDLLPLATSLASSSNGLITALPVVMGKNQALQFAKWHSGESLVPDAFNIPTPVTRVWVKPSVIFLPCVGYQTLNGKIYRLGYGGGYYDRSLALLRKRDSSVLAIGVAWRGASCQFNNQPHDQTLDHLLLAE